MDRFQPIDVSNSSLGAHLYPSEEVYLLTPGVGLYSGPSKSLPHASGTVYLTSHRLFYVDDAEPHRHSCFIKLSIIRETQYFAGFLKSSPKVTLGFREREEEEQRNDKQRKGLQSSTRTSDRGTASPTSNGRSSQDWRLTATAVDESANALPTTSWICRVCAFNNALDPGTNVNSTVRCALCGVPTDVKDAVLKPQGSLNTSAGANSSSPRLVNGVRNGAASSPTEGRANSKTDGVPCPVCTFSNHPSMLRCEMCDSPLATVDVTKSALRAATPSSDRAGTPSNQRTPSKTPEPTDEYQQQELYNHVRLSFRKGGDKPFYDTLKTTLKEKRWQRLGNGDYPHDGRSIRDTNSTSTSNSLARNAQRRYLGGRSANIDGRSAAAAAESDDDESLNSARSASRRVGIEGILSSVDLRKREETSDMQDALRDLEALMTRAKKMVDFAEALNAKLMKQEASQIDAGVGGEGQQQAANMIRTSMVRLGLPTPAITADMARDEFEYNVQLARELAGLLYANRRPLIGVGKVLLAPRSLDEQRKLQLEKVNKPLNEDVADVDTDHAKASGGRGILALDEVWCLWNRARGVALVSPKELLAVLPLVGRLTAPMIECKTFSSGLKVLHTPRYSEQCLRIRICQALQRQQESDEKQEDVRFANISTLSFAQMESCPVSLMQELLEDIELNSGTIVRDDHAGQITWYLNPFMSD